MSDLTTHIARVLVRTDGTAINFIEEMPYLEAASRSTPTRSSTEFFADLSSVSSQALFMNVANVASGLEQVKQAVRVTKGARNAEDDHFLPVMEVRSSIHNVHRADIRL